MLTHGGSVSTRSRDHQGAGRRRPLQQVESNFDRRVDGYRLTVLHAGFEKPLLDGFHGLLVEPQPKRLLDLDVTGMPGLIDDDRQFDRALPLCFASFFGILRLDFMNDRGLRNSAADAIHAAAESTAGTRTRAWTFP